MRLPKSIHSSRPWRIHEVVSEFNLEDVWSLPTPGGPGDFPLLVDVATSLDPAESSSFVVRTLFAVRFKLGEVLGWDETDEGVGARVSTLRDRLPADLRDPPIEEDLDGAPFAPLYVTHDEFAAETANKTVHGVIHLGWVKDGDAYRGEMAIYVKRNGLLGAAYMTAITPFRYLLVYPRLMHEIERKWRVGRAAGARA